MKIEILVVSSSPADAQLIKDLLADYDVQIFYNYNEAINMMENNENIRLLVLDIDK